MDGNYVINNAPMLPLRISYVGMKTQIVPVNSRTTNVVLASPPEEILNELVVIGYGTTTQKYNGSVDQINTATFENRPYECHASFTGCVG